MKVQFVVEVVIPTGPGKQPQEQSGAVRFCDLRFYIGSSGLARRCRIQQIAKSIERGHFKE
jgi:hypothetical protein